MNINDFITLANQQRRDNKDQWIFLMERVNGKFVNYKAYNTWIQVLKIEDCPYKLSGPMDCKVKDFTNFLLINLDKYLN